MGYLFAIVGILALVPIAMALDGWVISVLWSWFAVPYLHLPAISFVPAIGLKLTWSAFAHNEPAEKKDVQWWEPILKLLATPLVFLAFGWAIRMLL